MPRAAPLLALAAVLGALLLAGCTAPPCPLDVQAQARPDGGILVTWQAAPNATSYNVLRTGGGSAVNVTLPANATSYLDTATAPGVTYDYLVLAVNPLGASAGCAPVEVAAVPEFSPAAAAPLALAGVVVAALALRKR